MKRLDSIPNPGANSVGAAHHLCCEQCGGVPIFGFDHNPVMVVLGSRNPGFNNTGLELVVS